jgi:glucose/arabinose dehydrogenase
MPRRMAACSFAPRRQLVCNQERCVAEHSIHRPVGFPANAVYWVPDPDFESSQFIYIYYTTATPPIHNRVSRFTASGDVAAPGSEVAILELDNLSTATNHNGGALHFGPDGRLYVAAGENANAANAQSLSNLLGKLLRIDKSGSIPADNRFCSATGYPPWALGLRNPFTSVFSQDRHVINDVGQNTWEEINDGIVGANYDG